MITRRQVFPFFAVPFFFQAKEKSGTLSSAAFPLGDLPVRSSNGAQFRAILRGATATGEAIEAHETTLPAGGTPHAPHRHAHSEMWLVREGAVEVTINGVAHKLGPGGAAYASSNDLHGIRNVGNAPATYFVVAFGPGA